MIGDHKVISNGAYQLDYNQFSERLSLFEREVAPTFASYQKLKQELVEEKRQTMRLDEFKPKVMSAFVRNRLINAFRFCLQQRGIRLLFVAGFHQQPGSNVSIVIGLQLAQLPAPIVFQLGRLFIQTLPQPQRRFDSPIG